MPNHCQNCGLPSGRDPGECDPYPIDNGVACLRRTLRLQRKRVDTAETERDQLRSVIARAIRACQPEPHWSTCPQGADPDNSCDCNIGAGSTEVANIERAKIAAILETK